MRRFKIGFRCDGSGSQSNIQFSYKRDDQWHGLTYYGNNYCGSLLHYISPWEYFPLESTSHIQAFRIRMWQGQNKPLNLDMVMLVKETHHCSGWCPGILEYMITETTIGSYGAAGGNGYCINGVSSNPYDNCANDRSYRCLEFALDNTLREC